MKNHELLTELTDEMISDATVRFVLYPGGPGENWQSAGECGDEMVKYVRWALGEKTTYAEGKRLGVRGYGDSKWRFRVDEDREGRKWFAFIVQANAIIHPKPIREGVERQCREIAEGLQAAGFPVVMET